MKKVNEQLFNKLYKVALSSRFADGDEVVDKLEEKGKPTKDNTSDKAKAEFADGEEVAQNFNGNRDSEKMLETSAEENPIYKKASEALKKLAFDKGYTNIYEMLDKEDNLFAKYPDELAEIIADKTTTEEEAGEVFEAVERMIGEK